MRYRGDGGIDILTPIKAQPLHGWVFKVCKVFKVFKVLHVSQFFQIVTIFAIFRRPQPQPAHHVTGLLEVLMLFSSRQVLRSLNQPALMPRTV
jgi:hypothetical protein